MEKLASFLKFMYFYAGHAHRFVAHSSYFADHSFLGELYETYDDAYDAIVERMIGLGMEVNEFDIINAAAAQFNKHRDEKIDQNIGYFVRILAFEKQLCAMLNEANKNATLGSQNLIQDFCDQSEMRQYKLGQRVK